MGAHPIISRKDWGAKPPAGDFVRNQAIRFQVLHHSAGTTLSPKASIREEAEVVRQIQAAHLGQGWTDIAYHLIVMPSGRIYVGRPSWAVGAGVYGHNTGSVHVCIAGNYESAKPTKAAIEGAAKALRRLDGSDTRLYGHFELGPTACPGKNLKPRIADIARMRMRERKS